MLEAMSQGVPCLAMCGDGVRYHTANAEIIRDGVDGFLAASDDDFRLQLEKLLQVPQHLRLSRQGGDAPGSRSTTPGASTWTATNPCSST